MVLTDPNWELLGANWCRMQLETVSETQIHASPGNVLILIAEGGGSIRGGVVHLYKCIPRQMACSPL